MKWNTNMYTYEHIPYVLLAIKFNYHLMLGSQLNRKNVAFLVEPSSLNFTDLLRLLNSHSDNLRIFRYIIYNFQLYAVISLIKYRALR